jgi:hypothetical protein
LSSSYSWEPVMSLATCFTARHVPAQIPSACRPHRAACTAWVEKKNLMVAVLLSHLHTLMCFFIFRPLCSMESVDDFLKRNLSQHIYLQP